MQGLFTAAAAGAVKDELVSFHLKALRARKAFRMQGEGRHINIVYTAAAFAIRMIMRMAVVIKMFRAAGDLHL